MVTIYCDACPEGMGFWYPETEMGFWARTPRDGGEHFIFYFEALCVLSALYHADLSAPYASRILIYTDNQNTVDIFNSLRAMPEYNHILKASLLPTNTICVSCMSQELITVWLMPYHVSIFRGHWTLYHPSPFILSRRSPGPQGSMSVAFFHPLEKCWGQHHYDPICSTGQAACSLAMVTGTARS